MGSEGARGRQPWIFRNGCGSRPCCRVGEAGPPLTTASYLGCRSSHRVREEHRGRTEQTSRNSVDGHGGWGAYEDILPKFPFDEPRAEFYAKHAHQLYKLQSEAAPLWSWWSRAIKIGAELSKTGPKKYSLHIHIKTSNDARAARTCLLCHTCLLKKIK
jgi:hypothetical protein